MATKLLLLTPERQIEAWKEAVSTAPHGKITGEHVKKNALKDR